MVSVSTVSNTTQTGVASTATVSTSTTVAKTTTTATATPTISTTNSSTVKVSAAALTVAKAAVATPPTVAKAISDYQAAKTAGTLDAFAPVSIKDAAAALTDNADNRAVIREMVAAGKITGIAFTDTKQPTFTFDRSALSGDLTSTANQSPAQILQKITTKYTLAITNITATDALTIKPPVANATLALSVADASDAVTTNITALQTLAKAKTLTNVTFTAATPKPTLTITAAQLKASPELLATIKGDYDLTITGVAAADAVTVAGNADKVLKASGSQSTQAKVAITDTSANLVKNIAALEIAATAGRLTSITVSDGKALVLTEAQIKADSHFLATNFTNNATVEATAVAAADVLTVQSLVNANSKLTLTKESIADTAANIQANLDNLEAEVKAGGTTPATTTSTLSSIPTSSVAKSTASVPQTFDTNSYFSFTDNNYLNGLNNNLPLGNQPRTIEIQIKVNSLGQNVQPIVIYGSGSDNNYFGLSVNPIGQLYFFSDQNDANGVKNIFDNQWHNIAVTYDGTKVNLYVDGTLDVSLTKGNAGVPKDFTNINTLAGSLSIGSIRPLSNDPLYADVNSVAVWNKCLTPTEVQTSPQNLMGSEQNLVSLYKFNKSDIINGKIYDKVNNNSFLNVYGSNNITTPKINPIISSITATDKGSITVTNSTLVKDIDALKVLTGKYTLNVTDIAVSDALALKAPSKDATLAISVKDTAANIAANWDKLQTVAKAKTLASINVTDSASSLLSMTAAQLKSDADALKLVAGDYKLAVTGVAAADVTKTLTTKNIYSVEIKDTAANILKNLASIQNAVTAAKIQNVVITDATNPSLSISDIFALTTTLPNVTLASGVKFNVKDTASTIIAHARDDIGDVLKNAGTVTISDKTTPNLTLADAITLKGITNLDKTTKYNMTDGGSVIATQAAIAGETILSGATSVTIIKNFSISDAKAVTGIKTLAKGTVYSITDTADNVLAQSAVSGDKILSGANTVTVVDTSANIIAKLDQLEILAKAGKIADIKFTDTPSAALSITNEQLVKDAEAIGKIVSHRILPTLSIPKPATPTPLEPARPVTFDLNLPAGSYKFLGIGLTSNGSKEWGNFYDQNGLVHAFIVNTDGTGFIDLAPQDSTQAWINGLTPDGSKAWGVFYDQNYQSHAFITKIDGTGFVDLSPQGATRSWLNGSTPDGLGAWGQYQDQNGQWRAFITKTDGTGFVDLSPQGATNSGLGGLTPDGSKAWGQFTDKNGQSHAFITKTDGTGIVDLSPQGSTYSKLNGITPDGSKAWGDFTDQNGHQHAFITKIDGTGFIDLTPQSADYSVILGSTPDGLRAWGWFQDQNGQQHAFITKTDGTGFVDLTPQDATNSRINGLTPDGSKAWGQFTDKNGQQHAFITKIDGTGFVDLNPQGATYSEFGGLSSDGSKAWGNFFDQNNQLHPFTIKTDGTGFTDLTPPNAINSTANGITPDDKILGIYQTADQKWHGFIVPT